MTTFADFGLSESTMAALKKKGFETPSPIQASCIPLLLDSDEHVIGQAQTGTGKTAAFGIPVIERVDARSKKTQALILAPTRELALQVAEEMSSFKGSKKVKVAVIYGGVPISRQFRALEQGAQIVVGTPGRIIDHIKRGSLQVDHLKYCILDEADEMLNQGFLEDIEYVLDRCNENKQMLFFSATMPREIIHVAKRYMGEYQLIKAKAQQLTTTNTEQLYLEVREQDKFEALCRVIDIEEDFYAIIFCRTKVECEELAQKLQYRGYQTEAIHGDIVQKQRERVLRAFKQRKITILTATDVAARGIDVNDLTHVINYHIPQDPESYTHRIGRTGRAGKKGTAITFVTPSEYRRLIAIKRRTNSDIAKQSIPSIDDVMGAKKTSMMDDINKAIETNLDNYDELLAPLLDKYDSNILLKALMHVGFGHHFDPRNYRTIEKVNMRDPGPTTLFVARGRDHGLGPRDVAEFLKKEGDITDRDILNIRIYDGFSFVTCPFAVAEHLLMLFKRQSKGRKPLVSKAKPRDGGGRGGYRGNRGGHRGGNRRGGERRRRY